MSATIGKTTPISEWTENEIIFPAEKPQVGQRTSPLFLPLFLPERRIYLYLEANVSGAGSFSLFTAIRMSIGNTVVGVIPCKLCDFTALTPNQSASRLFNSGGSPVGDSAVLTLAQPFNAAITNVTVQPLRINAQIDRLDLQVTGVSVGVMTGWRAWIGCLSTAY